MKIYELIWPEDQVYHIPLHGIEPEEVEEVCFGQALVQRTKSTGKNPVYYVTQVATRSPLLSAYKFIKKQKVK